MMLIFWYLYDRFGAALVTLNAQLLGGTISFFQSICILGYCVFPLTLSAFACMIIGLLYKQIILKLLIVGVGFVWSTRASGISNELHIHCLNQSVWNVLRSVLWTISHLSFATFLLIITMNSGFHGTSYQRRTQSIGCISRILLLHLHWLAYLAAINRAAKKWLLRHQKLTEGIFEDRRRRAPH